MLLNLLSVTGCGAVGIAPHLCLLHLWMYIELLRLVHLANIKINDLQLIS